MSARHRRVYLAAPLSMFGTVEYTRAIVTVKERFPAEVLDAAALFQGNENWRERSSELLPMLDGLVFIADSDGSIGRGVYSEIQDVRSVGKPVWLLGFWTNPPLPTLHEYEALDLRTHPGNDWRRYATVGIRS